MTQQTVVPGAGLQCRRDELRCLGHGRVLGDGTPVSGLISRGEELCDQAVHRGRRSAGERGRSHGGECCGTAEVEGGRSRHGGRLVDFTGHDQGVHEFLDTCGAVDQIFDRPDEGLGTVEVADPQGRSDQEPDSVAGHRITRRGVISGIEERECDPDDRPGPPERMTDQAQQQGGRFEVAGSRSNLDDQ
ncbi:hypothetical protein [Lentzea xinjiangensis]|uniref:hypothetical protein n=1 Tax=Lentzea xinjiangensis TaxID=402600 RepID=UPI00116081C5|nr:hypothetical protein [Lentzea xinjiangensis]